MGLNTKILVVDDNLRNINILRGILEDDFELQTAIAGFSSLLLMDNTISEESQEFISQIQIAERRLSDRLDRLLLLSSLKELNTVEKQDIGASDLIMSAMYQLESQSTEKGVRQGRNHNKWQYEFIRESIFLYPGECRTIFA